MLTALTDLADPALLLCLIVLIFALLALQGWAAGAWAWLCTMLGTVAVIAALKIVFLGCAALSDTAGIRSPSGHVAIATVFAGALTASMTRSRATILAVSLAASVAIGATRLLLNAHSLVEIIVGAAVGLAGVFVFAACAGTPPKLRARWMLACIGLTVVAVYGARLPAEAAIEGVARRLSSYAPLCRMALLPGATSPRGVPL